MVELRELLGCNVIVFDAVILQCRAYTYASAAHGHIGHIRGVVITAFPPPPSGSSVVLLLFGRHSAVHDSLPPPHSGAICQVVRPFHHVDQEHLEVFQPTSCLDGFSAIIFRESSARLDGRESRNFEIAKRGICLVPWFNRSWKIASSSLNVSGSVKSICIYIRRGYFTVSRRIFLN